MTRELVGVLVVLVGTALAGGLTVLGLVAALLDRFGARAMSRRERRVALIAAVVSSVELGCFLYGVFIEADQLEVTHQRIETHKLAAGVHLRIAHFSDLHVDRDSPALQKLIDAMHREKPDLIVFTGDSVNRAASVELLHSTLRQLDAPLGRFAVRGNHDIAYWSKLDLFGNGVAIELANQKPMDVGPASICGAPWRADDTLEPCLRAAGDRFTIVAYHTPDLIEDLTPRPDLYLAGHTHGGQVRIPFYGAVLTFARHGKRYEMGRYEVNGTTLYVNRGIGFEPHAPRVRFLAPPELTIIDLEGVGR